MASRVPDDNEYPQSRTGPNGYNRLSNLELESQSATVIVTAAPTRTPVEQQTDCSTVYEILFTICYAALIMTAILALPGPDPYEYVGDQTDNEGNYIFTLDSLVISDMHVSPGQVAGKCQAAIRFSNLGHESYYQENFIVSVFLRHELLWVMRTGDSFLVEGGTSLTYNASMEAAGNVLAPAGFVRTGLSSGQPVMFKVKYDGMMRKGSGGWRDERTHIYAVCGWVKMQFVNESTLVGGQATCYCEDC